MILVWLLAILIAGGLIAWPAARLHPRLSRLIALVSLTSDLALALFLAVRDFGAASAPASGWREELAWSWVPQFGISFHLGLDGLSLLLVLLTLFLGTVAVIVSWTEISKAVGFYYFNLLLILAGILGVLLSLDLFLFYFSWELMLVPMYFLISVWGGERRSYAATKFFLFTQLSGLLMLIALVALFFAHHQATGIYSFEYQDLLRTHLGAHTATWIMLGFLAAFAVKLPIFPFHTWLPDACSEATSATNLVLASIMAATAAYSMIRFLLPLFPEATSAISPVMIVLAVIGILYSAILAFSQTNLMRLIAYASIGHLGFVLLGIFSGSSLALRGAVITVIAHSISIGALFLIAGALERRVGSQDLAAMGGLWETIPRLSAFGLLFALAALGLPGLGDFIGEFLILIGTYQAHIAAAAVAACGVLAATFYALRLVQLAFQGPNRHSLRLTDLAPREALLLGILMIVLLWLGLYPQPVFQTLAKVASNAPNLWR